ncbi:MAG TPA: response regulator [Spirochaetota bacterium]|jgi:two-component system chemotaxis response regulator CheY|nr:response regulator [Spirochaetota bacterium]OQA97863.1 MAG: Chemotaxis protein CheY [Spirochaetes bacterium ADurb.Bin218]HPP95615.1 response regulator [Spirochaetota bacterium]
MAKVMIVDDSKLMRKKLSDLITSAGHTVVAQCERGDEALRAYLVYKPDLVTMDINMPGLNGIEAIQQIKKADKNARILIISSESDEMNILQGIHNGASGFMVKPFTDERVIRTIQRLLVNIEKKAEEKKNPALKDLNFDEKVKGLILIIDDSKVVLKATSDILKKDGHNIITANNGKTGLSLAETGVPDLIILDIEMPDMDGYDVLRELKKNETTKNIPVIMHSSKTKKEDILLAMKLGIIDYIAKNTSDVIIRGKIKSALIQSRTKKELLEKNSGNIIIDRKGFTTYISFRFTLKSEAAVMERKKLFSGAFLKTLEPDNIIMDFRQINEMDDSELSHVKYILTIFPDKELLIVCGKHYGSIVSEFETEGKNKFFISLGDAETFIENRDEVAGFLNREGIAF